jgi:uncharacterized Zn-binding protein involved in type VI secretion
MLKRYLITLGAPTTSGGRVISAHHFRTINGVKVAVEGDWLECPQCHSKGVIKPAGPRLTELCNGKQVALHDDLCICKCSPPPRLIADQILVCQVIDVEWHADEVAKKLATVQADTTTSQTSPAPKDELPLLLLDPETQEPCKHRPYKLQLKDEVIEGTTDEHGATRPLSASERASVLTWHVDDETSSASPRSR